MINGDTGKDAEDTCWGMENAGMSHVDEGTYWEDCLDLRWRMVRGCWKPGEEDDEELLEADYMEEEP